MRLRRMVNRLSPEDYTDRVIVSTGRLRHCRLRHAHQGDARLTRRAAAPAMLGEAQAGSRRERRLVRDGKGDVLQMALGVGM